jgi:hypothetical protein
MLRNAYTALAGNDGSKKVADKTVNPKDIAIGTPNANDITNTIKTLAII